MQTFKHFINSQSDHKSFSIHGYKYLQGGKRVNTSD